MAEWYFVRHGETRWNAEQRVQGQTDVPMHGAGHDQAAKTAERLAGLRFDAVYASDLCRTRETAERIIAASSTGPHDLRLDRTLREMAFGEFEGMTWAGIASARAALPERQRARDLDYSPQGGESYRQLLDRLGGFAARLEREHADDDVLVVGHGAALRALVVRLLGLPDEAYWSFAGLGSGSISRLRRREGHTSVAAWNDVGHILPLAMPRAPD